MKYKERKKKGRKRILWEIHKKERKKERRAENKVVVVDIVFVILICSIISNYW